MKCVRCNTDNPEGAKFCHKCGHKLSGTEPPKVTVDDVKKGFSEAASSAASFAKECQNELRTFLEAESVDQNDTICPFCHSTGCQPMQKNSASIKQSGYSFGNGCCGMCLLGPFGLLCGLCGMGSKVDIKNETWWTCLNCGKEHISQQSAIGKADTVIATSFLYALIGGISLSFAIHRFGFSFISIFLLGLTVSFSIGPWYSIFSTLKEELGYSIIDILPPEKKKSYFYQFIGCMAMVLLTGLFFIPLLASWVED